jgi:hypothetical protein
VRRLNFGLINFKFSLVDVLCRALPRAAIYFKFTFISVLRRVLRRATVYLNFILFNVWHRASSRTTFRFKFSLVTYAVVRFVARRLTLFFIINSSISLCAPSRDD